MAAPNSAASKKSAKAGAKKIAIAKPGIKKTVLKAPATSAKASKAASLKALKSPALKTLKLPAMKALKTPAMKNLKTPAVKSKKNPAAVKKASPLRKIGDKAIKKTTGKKAKQIKGGLGGVKNNLEGGAKASAGGVAAFDLEAFVKVKFSELEKTAHQKKVSQMLLSQCILQFHVSERVWTDQQHRGGAEQVQHEGGERALQGEEGGQP